MQPFSKMSLNHMVMNLFQKFTERCHLSYLCKNLIPISLGANRFKYLLITLEIFSKADQIFDKN